MLCSALPGWIPMLVTVTRGRNQICSLRQACRLMSEEPRTPSLRAGINSMRLVTSRPVIQEESRARMS